MPASHGTVAQRGDILGVLSLIIWSLTIIVTIKYIMFVLRADNRGEGGVLSLMALARGSFPKRSAIILGIGIVGASLFFGDAVITPAISVLSAVEGMNVVTPAFQPYVVPLTLVILAMVFAVQRFGTGGVGLVFGPVTAVWFLAIGLSGLKHIIADPEILWAISPHYIVAFLIHSPDVAFVTIGAIFLAVTGAEALYADLGHFGRKPIVLAWLSIVFPCLLLNYAGQGAFVLAKNGVVGHPFFEMNEGWALIPMVVLATAATVIASQAVISGAFSLTRQAVQLNMLPRLEILHTSEKQSGQIYMPRVNLLLALVVMMLVVGFGESSKLASAYGISVTGNMLVTTVLLYVVMTRIWKWRLWVAIQPDGAVCLHRYRFLRLQHRQGVRRRLGVAAGGLHHRAGHVDLGARQPLSVRQDPPQRNPARFPRRQFAEEKAAAGVRHRGVPDQRSAQRADRADAQPEALQGAA